MISIAHIINPAVVEKTSDLFFAQPITFETMRIARQVARGQAEVELFSAQFAEDRPIIPNDFETTRDLERSVLNTGTFENGRKLPLLKDILDRLYEESEADYFIYSNADIALMPYFYVVVGKILEQGCDALVINRRTITDRFTSVNEISLMYAEAGESHPGHDCFVFRREAYPKYRLGEVCVGVNWVGRVLLWNLVCQARRFKEHKRKHLTFHLGNEKAWKTDDYVDYVAHNEREARSALAILEDEYGPLSQKRALTPYLTDVFLILNADNKVNIGAFPCSGSLIERMKKALNRLVR